MESGLGRYTRLRGQRGAGHRKHEGKCNRCGLGQQYLQIIQLECFRLREWTKQEASRDWERMVV